MSNLDTLLYLDDPLISDAKKNTIKLTNPLQISLEENTAIQEPVEIMVDLVAVEGGGSIPTVSFQASMNSRDDILAMAGSGKGGGNGSGRPDNPGGGGGHTEPVGNNLSFPVIWADGTSLSVPGTFGQPELTVPYTSTTKYQFDTNADGLPDADAFAFAQKTEGNSWQAESFSSASAIYITEIDWGDSLESVDMKVGRPIRIELSLYKNLSVTKDDETALPDGMLAFPMTMLANPSSPDEVQGAGSYTVDGSQPLTYTSTEATVYSDEAKLIIQKLDGTREDVAKGDLQWNGSQWVDANLVDPTDIADPLTGIVFAGELNVAGKVIYGLSQGGWRPKEVGDYRITFYLPQEKNIQLDDAIIRESIETDELLVSAEDEGGDTGGGQAYVLGSENLTYIDIRVIGGGGGGRPQTASDPMLAQFEQLDLISGSTSDISPIVASELF